jgi:hypothetical protein
MRFFLCAAVLALVAIPCSAQTFVFTDNNQTPNSVSAFRAGPTGGLLPIPGSPYATGGNGGGSDLDPGQITIAIVHAKRFLYAANNGSGTVSAFGINLQTGQLTPVAGSPFTAGSAGGNFSIAATPNVEFLFTSDEISPAIHVFSVDGVTGALTEVAGSPFPAGGNVEGLKVTANSKYLLAGLKSANKVQVFRIPATGQIASVTTVAASGAPDAIEVNCANTRVFVADSDTGLIDVYALAVTGAISPIHGSPYANGSGGNTTDVKLSPNGAYLFTTDAYAGAISALQVASSGALSPVAGSPFAVSGWNSSLSIPNAGNVMYDFLFSGMQIDGRVIGSSGALTSVPGTPFSTRQPSGGYPALVAYPPPVCGE